MNLKSRCLSRVMLLRVYLVLNLDRAPLFKPLEDQVEQFIQALAILIAGDHHVHKSSHTHRGPSIKLFYFR